MLGEKRKAGALEVAEYYTHSFFEDMDALSIIQPDTSARANGHISPKTAMNA